MRPFSYERADDLGSAAQLGAGTAQGQVDAPTQFLAGGTTLLDLMKLDVLRPARVIDLALLAPQLNSITADASGLHLGALASMADAAEHPLVREPYPVLSQSLLLAASAQLRNMATLGGNVLQKTRCPYYRDPSWAACNKRVPGSGCAAIGGFNRNHAILGVDETCIAQYPGDFGVALIALNAEVEVWGAAGRRRFRFDTLHRPVAGQPYLETTLLPGETIVGFHIPATPWARRSVYVKVRDRASYEFALSSAAVVLGLQGDRVEHVHIGLGGMAYRPWRAKPAEDFLVGKVLSEASAAEAARAALQGAKTHGINHFKVQLAQQTIVRALSQARGLSISEGTAHAG